MRREPVSAAARDARTAYERARDHWASCEQCRYAAMSSASTWCDLGLQLMKDGVATGPHWDACPRCHDAQAQVRSRQCTLGRELDDAYRLASERLVTEKQLRKGPATA